MLSRHREPHVLRTVGLTIDPTDVGVKNPVPANPLVYYPAAHPLLDAGATGDGWGNTSTLFNGSTEVRGIVFPENTRSVLFFGRHGLGEFCYGPGTDDPALAGQPVPGTPDELLRPGRRLGRARLSYAARLAHDANDLAAVKAGQRALDRQAHAVWTLTLPFAD
jgi:hypothetical protein